MSITHEGPDPAHLKVLLAAPVPPPDHGGIATWTRIVRQYLGARPDVHLTLVDTTARYRAVTNLSLGVRLVGGSAQAVRDIYRLHRRVHDDRPDLLHVCTSGGPAVLKDYLLMRMARRHGVAGVMHYRMGRLPAIAARNGIEWRWTRRTMALAGAVVCLDEASDACVRSALPDRRVVRLPNMVETDVLDGIVQEADPPIRPSECFNVVFAGHVVPAKGVRELVAACLSLPGLPVTLHVVGPVERSFRAELERLAGGRSEGKWLHFLGPASHAETIRFIAAADLFVLPSHTEGMPNVVLEAMACRRPILATTVGAVPELLGMGTPDECGVCVPPREVEPLAAAIARLLKSADQRRALGVKARQRVEKYYAVPVACQQLLDFWRSVAGHCDSATEVPHHD
jgi:glycosyltransferase involved in cell wall biosynthesis